MVQFQSRDCPKLTNSGDCSGANCGLGHRLEANRHNVRNASLTIATLQVGYCDAWTLMASLTISSSYKKCSNRRTSGRSAQATSLLPIDGTMWHWLTVRGSGCGSSSAFAAEVNPMADFGFSPDVRHAPIRNNYSGLVLCE